jgi:putative mRNA 3-end processing factor
MALALGDYKVALDSSDKSANVNFVSHAHTDHMAGLRKNRKALASEMTKDLIECRSGFTVELAEEPDCVDLLDAGHIPGSKQLYVENELYGYSVVYSGDYQMSRPLIGEKIKVREADVLIMDSTYPDPKVVFEDRGEVVTAIQHYARMKLDRGIVLFGAHIIGRAQELISILNEVGITPLVDEKICRANSVYRKHGIGLSYRQADLFADGLGKGENFVAIAEQSKLDPLREKLASECPRRVFTAVATGLAKSFRFGTDVQFALSDHADFPQAIEYINACNPKLILTFGQRSDVFAKNLALKGYNARPLRDTSQLHSVTLNHI